MNVQKNKKLQKTSFDINNTQLFYENEDLNRSVPADDGILKIGISRVDGVVGCIHRSMSQTVSQADQKGFRLVGFRNEWEKT